MLLTPWLFVFPVYGSAAVASHCSQPLNTNLVSNPNFETGSLSPWRTGDGKASYSIVSPGHNSKYAAQYTFHGSLMLSQNVSTCSNTLYNFSMDFLVQPATAGTIQFDFYFGNVQRTFDNDADNAWRTFRGLFINPYPSSYSSTIDLGGFQVHETPIDYVRFDNFVVEAISTAPLTPVPHIPEHFRNPGFQTGSFAPWTFSGMRDKPKVASPGINSSYALHFFGENFLITQTIGVVAGTPYLFGMDYEANHPMFCTIAQYYGRQSETYELQIPAAGSGRLQTPITGLKNGTVTISVECAFELRGVVVVDNLSFRELQI